jgi:hypothetical protein
MLSIVASVVLQESVAVEPEVIEVGLAVNEVIVGAGVGGGGGGGGGGGVVPSELARLAISAAESTRL